MFKFKVVVWTWIVAEPRMHTHFVSYFTYQVVTDSDFVSDSNMKIKSQKSLICQIWSESSVFALAFVTISLPFSTPVSLLVPLDWVRHFFPRFERRNSKRPFFPVTSNELFSGRTKRIVSFHFSRKPFAQMSRQSKQSECLCCFLSKRVEPIVRELRKTYERDLKIVSS